MKKNCETCRWRSDDFTSVCVNADSDHVADFVSAIDVCDEWEHRMEGQDAEEDDWDEYDPDQ